MIAPRLFLTLLLAAVLATPATAQTLTFVGGRTASLSAVRVVGDSVLIPFDLQGHGSGEIRLPVADIMRLDWPEPPELAESATLLAAGRAADALASLDKTLPLHASFKGVDGSWWAKLMARRVSALAKLGRDIDAEVALTLLRRSKHGADLVPDAVLDIASASLDAGKTAQARQQLDLVQLPENDHAAAARIAILRGRLLLSEGKAEDSLLSFLRVRALYPRVAEQQPAALLGAAAAYASLGENARADIAREQLRTRYPDSPEAAKARR